MNLFGEINENCSSRSAFEDWDDTPEDTVDIDWSNPLEVPDAIEALYILEGQYLADCVSAQSQDFIQLINIVTNENLLLYKIKTANKYICTIKSYNLLQSSKLIELLNSFILKSTDVLILITKPISEYQAVNIWPQSCIVRKINTSPVPKIFGDIVYEKLEQPNIITGVSAGVISLRDHHNLPATALVFYVESNNMYEIEELNKQLQRFHIIQTLAKVPNTIYNSNLYI